MKNKLDFCPYEGDDEGFRKIDLNNLAYELLFMKDQGVEDLKKTVIGEADYITKDVDEKRREEYMDQSIRYILKAAEPGETLSGLQKLLRDIDTANDSETTDGRAEITDTSEKMRKSSEKKSGSIKLRYEQKQDGVYVFYYVATGSVQGKRLMRAVPCCPSCHGRLPQGWFDADDFCPIDLMGKRTEGKTTMLLALLANDWKKLKEGAERGWEFDGAHEVEKEYDFFYGTYQEWADTMTNESPKRSACYCPDSTQPLKSVSPVFFKAEYNGKLMIVGLYDNSGETLENPTINDPKMLVLTNTYAHIYLIDPKQMKIALPEQGTEKSKSVSETVELMTIEEQGRYQKEHHREEMIAETLLQAKATSVAVRETDPFEVLSKYRSFMKKTYSSHKLKEQHLCFTIVKSDLLKELDEIKEIPFSQFLFENSKRGKASQNQAARQDILENVFDKLVFDDEKDEITEKFASHSLHMVSALGCDTEKREVFEDEKKLEQGIEVVTKKSMGEQNVLKGKFAPIRIAEPLMTCLQRRAEKNGW